MKKINRLVIYITAGLLIGEIFCKFNIEFLWGLVLVPVIWIVNVTSRKNKRENAVLNLLFLLCVYIGQSMFAKQIKLLNTYDVIENGENMQIIGEVRNIWENEYGVTVEIRLAEDGIKVICYFDDFDCEMGRQVLIKGKKKQMKESSNPGEFDLKKYYNSKEIFLSLEDCTLVRKGEEYSEISQMFYRIRQGLKKSILKMCDVKEAGVLCAMLFGDKANLDGEIKDLYTMAGIGHILAISGLHISMAGGAMYHFMRKFVRQPAAFLVSSGIMLCFCGISGANVSTVRAVIMYIISIFAKVIGRKYDIKNALAISMILVLADNPLYINNGGFILSFLSVAGVAFVLPVVCFIFEEVLYGNLFSHKIVKSFITSASLYFVTLMGIAYMYYEVPVYSIILNMLLLPMMGMVVISGFMGGILYYVLKPLGEIIILLSVTILKIYELVCQLFANLPANICITGGKETGTVIGYYFIFFMIMVICILLKKKKIAFKRIMCALGCGIVIMLVLVFSKKDYCFNISILDIGQGDCIYLESTDGSNYLVDGGSSDEKNIGKYKIEPFLKHRGRGSLKAVFVTHPDNDHINGILELIENGRIEVENIIFGAGVDKENKNYIKLCGLAMRNKINIEYVKEGDCIEDSELKLSVLAPIEDKDYVDLNAASIVLLGNCKDYKFLLTGDIGVTEEKALISGKYRENIRNVNLLKVAHHGSNNSNCEEFLSWVNPKVSIISCGRDNSYGHPHKEVLERLKQMKSEIFITMNKGAVEVE